MNFLQSTINKEINKRKNVYKRAAETDSSDVKKVKKYVTVAQIQEQENRLRAEKEEAGEMENERKSVEVKKEHKEEIVIPIEQKPNRIEDEIEKYDLPESEIIKRLRARNEPIRLFAESEKDRKIRLRTLELLDERSTGQRNDFMKVLEEMESGTLLDELKKKSKLENEDLEKRRKKIELFDKFDTQSISPKLLEESPEQNNTLIYAYFKKLLIEWEEYLYLKPDEERKTINWKLAAATQRQSVDYMKPFFRMIKRKASTSSINPDVLERITEIAMYMHQREYIKANDCYLRLAIGNAPWPIGVTMVGIHERSARENINASKVAHVLNDETQRKWIQSIKRLITFAQTKYPPDDLAKKVG